MFDADRDAGRAEQAGKEVNGFSFGDASEGAVDEALNRALRWYRGEAEGEGGGEGKGPSERFLKLVESGMRQDWSWSSAADASLKIYDEICSERGAQAEAAAAVNHDARCKTRTTGKE